MKHLSQYFTERLSSHSPVLEGGISGHLMHPFDAEDLTGYDIEELIKTVFGGKVEGMTEKMDGFGIQATMNRQGDVVFIRNKAQLNSDKGGMTIDEFPSQWDDNPKALENYTNGAKLIEAVFKKIGPNWFNPSEGVRRIANCECIVEGTTNTIPYSEDQVDFHNIWVYEWNGSEWLNTEVTKKGLDVLKKACEGIDKIQITPTVIIKYSEETARLEKKWLAEWQKFLKTYDCAPDSTIEGIKCSLFFKWVEKNAAWMMDDYKSAMGCFRRWLFDDRKYMNLKNIKASYQDHLDEFNKLESSPSKVTNTVCLPLQKFFYEMGADVVKVTSGFVNAGKDDTIKTLLKDLKTATEKIKKEGSFEDNEHLQIWLDVLNDIGEENLSCAEGVVFSYKDKLLKFTGGFVPLNKIIGYSKYNMKPKSLTESLFDVNLISKDNAFINVITFLSKFFTEWKYKYEFEYDKNYRWVDVIFKRQISDARCARLCADLNSRLQWSKFDKDYICRWGNAPDKNSFIITIYKKQNKTE